MIEADGLRKRYGEQLAVADVSLSVAQGRILGVLGPNGAGKSTTVRMLTTMTQPDAGMARVAGPRRGHRGRARCAASSA